LTAEHVLQQICKIQVSILNIVTAVYIFLYVLYTVGLKMTLLGQNMLPR